MTDLIPFPELESHYARLMIDFPQNRKHYKVPSDIASIITRLIPLDREFYLFLDPETKKEYLFNDHGIFFQDVYYPNLIEMEHLITTKGTAENFLKTLFAPNTGLVYTLKEEEKEKTIESFIDVLEELSNGSNFNAIQLPDKDLSKNPYYKGLIEKGHSELRDYFNIKEEDKFMEFLILTGFERLIGKSILS